MTLWAIPFRGSLKMAHKPFVEGGMHLQVPKLKPDDKFIPRVLRLLERN